MTDGQAASPAPQRLAYDAEFVGHMEDFCKKVLAAVPELHGLAIVPVWHSQPENMPPGFIHLQPSVQPPFANSLLTLLKRLAAFNTGVQKDLIGQLGMIERYVEHLTKMRDDRLAEITQLAKHQESEPDDQTEKL